MTTFVVYYYSGTLKRNLGNLGARGTTRQKHTAKNGKERNETNGKTSYIYRHLKKIRNYLFVTFIIPTFAISN